MNGDDQDARLYPIYCHRHHHSRSFYMSRGYITMRAHPSILPSARQLPKGTLPPLSTPPTLQDQEIPHRKQRRKQSNRRVQPHRRTLLRRRINSLTSLALHQPQARQLHICLVVLGEDGHDRRDALDDRSQLVGIASNVFLA
ncbi:hypothetical protein B5807_04415 [Epicoccum nigrum]|uniref:Uncharacterized protein n=1 Tax=Epicoccum nigrum TaxID=105696 RepID=A0A1Y2M539_EPING|nr:hypothetical protein B5807_04415 [Epicoccum nigrum]